MFLFLINRPNVVASSSTSLQKQFTVFCNNDLHISVMPEDISTVHKLPANRNGNSSNNSSNGNSNVIARFAKRSVKDNVFFAKKALRDYNTNNTDKIYVNEDLTAHNRKIFNAASYKVKNKLLAGVWTTHCKVVVKLIDESTKQVKTLNELNAFV